MLRIRELSNVAAGRRACPGGRPDRWPRLGPPRRPIPTQPQTAAEMKPYTETIPGTNIKFDMIPIPGGTYTMGSPADEKGRNEDEGPQRQVDDRAVLDGQVRGHLGRVRPVSRSASTQAASGANGDTKTAAGRRGHPADAALCRRDLRLRPRDGSRPSA